MENKFIGIDISKQTFDASFQLSNKWHFFSLNNKVDGYEALAEHLNPGDVLVMEASGPYYLLLANYFYSKGFKVVVVNPLVIKRYSQMRLYRAKTDKKDAQTIAEYVASNELKIWKPEEEQISKLKQLQTAIEGLQKASHQISRQLEAMRATGVLDKELEKDLSQTITYLKKKIQKLEKRQLQIATKYYNETLKRLQTIPGIGRKTAVMLITITNDFRKFNNYKKLIAYVGFSPRIYQSGSSINGKGHICKMGKAQIRKLLYMCSWSAKHKNKACIEMYERLKAKGKPERVIKVAIANKLIKQAFALIKNNQFYNENYQSKACF